MLQAGRLGGVARVARSGRVPAPGRHLACGEPCSGMACAVPWANLGNPSPPNNTFLGPGGHLSPLGHPVCRWPLHLRPAAAGAARAAARHHPRRAARGWAGLAAARGGRWRRRAGCGWRCRVAQRCKRPCSSFSAFLSSPDRRVCAERQRRAARPHRAPAARPAAAGQRAGAHHLQVRLGGGCSKVPVRGCLSSGTPASKQAASTCRLQSALNELPGTCDPLYAARRRTSCRRCRVPSGG